MCTYLLIGTVFFFKFIYKQTKIFLLLQKTNSKEKNSNDFKNINIIIYNKEIKITLGNTLLSLEIYDLC